MERRHVVITGTGRTGTTFLVILLSELGFDTGFSAACPEPFDMNARAGLEQDIRLDDAPYIIKNPWFCDHAQEVLDRDDIVIEHVFIPIRELFAAAESRRFVVRQGSKEISSSYPHADAAVPADLPGGLWHTQSNETGAQEEVLLNLLYNLLLKLSAKHIPVTLLQYPKLVQDDRYLFLKLKPILGEMSFEIFSAAFRKTVRPDWIHSFSKGDK